MVQTFKTHKLVYGEISLPYLAAIYTVSTSSKLITTVWLILLLSKDSYVCAGKYEYRFRNGNVSEESALPAWKPLSSCQAIRGQGKWGSCLTQ